MYGKHDVIPTEVFFSRAPFTSIRCPHHFVPRKGCAQGATPTGAPALLHYNCVHSDLFAEARRVISLILGSWFCRHHSSEQVAMRPIADFIRGGGAPEGVPWPGQLPTTNTAVCNLGQALIAIRQAGGSPLREPYVVNVGGTSPHWNFNYSPCLTRARGSSGGHWLTWKQRLMTPEATVFMFF